MSGKSRYLVGVVKFSVFSSSGVNFLNVVHHTISTLSYVLAIFVNLSITSVLHFILWVIFSPVKKLLISILCVVGVFSPVIFVYLLGFMNVLITPSKSR